MNWSETIRWIREEEKERRRRGRSMYEDRTEG